MITVADRIYELRHRDDMTQEELGQRLRTTGVSVGLWERGKRTPTKDNIYKMAKVFDVSVAYMLGDMQESDISDSEIKERTFEDEPNPVGALFFLLGSYMRIDDVVDSNGETQIIATIKGDVAQVINGMMYVQKGVEKGIFDSEMMKIWKEKEMQKHGIEVRGYGKD